MSDVSMPGKADRKYWLDTMLRISEIVLRCLSERRLHTLMPVESRLEERAQYSHLEALGRTLAGISPWLDSGAASGSEGHLRSRCAELARAAIAAAVDPASPDYMNFSSGQQPLVDAAFLAHALLRAPQELIGKLPSDVREMLADSLRLTRTILPASNNWLLFSAMVEVALRQMGEDWDRMRVDYAIKQHMQWYKGDGAYGDGPSFHWDYYNSFVIQPMLLDILTAVQSEHQDWQQCLAPVIRRAVRYAGVLERQISPEGTYPLLGRSIVYRFGAFQLLSQMALRQELPEGIVPAQVRCALTAVIRRTMQQPGTFDETGWLTIGLCGHQPELGEKYISTGSLYLCTTVFLPLGLAADDPFWTGEADWTSKQAWGGMPLPADRAISD